MVGDDKPAEDQQQAQAQHNLQWMDKLIGKGVLAVGSGGKFLLVHKFLRQSSSYLQKHFIG